MTGCTSRRALYGSCSFGRGEDRAPHIILHMSYGRNPVFRKNSIPGNDIQTWKDIRILVNLLQFKGHVQDGKLAVSLLCYNPGSYHQFSLIFRHLFLRSRLLIPHLFPHAPLGPPPNHLTSHLMDHLTIPQSTITCHHSAVRSIPQHHHLTLYGLPAHDALFLDRQLMMELYLELPRHDASY